MKNSNSLKINAIFNTLYQILILIVPLITAPYVSRVLGAANNGIYANFYSLVQYFVLFTSFGFTEYGTKKIAESRDFINNKTALFFSIYLTRIILGLMSLLAYIGTIFLCFDKSQRSFGLIYLIYIIAAMIDPVFYFQGEEKFVSICIRNFIIKLLSTILIFIFVKSESDLVVYTLILVLSQVMSALIILPSINFRSFSKIKFFDLKIKITLKNSFAFFVPSLAVTLFTYLNQTLLGFLGNDNLDSGYFSQAVKIIQILACIPSSLNIIMLSRISYLTANNNIEEIKIKIKKTFQVFWAIAWPIFFGLCAISSVFIPLFLGEGYEECVLLVCLLSPTIIFGPLNGLYGNLYFKPQNKIRVQTGIIFASAILNLILCIILIPTYGSVGSSVGRIAAEFLQLPLLMFFSRKYMDNKLTFLSGLKAFVNSLVMFIIVMLIKKYIVLLISNEFIILIILIIVGFICYSLLEIITKDEVVITNLKIIINRIKFILKRKN